MCAFQLLCLACQGFHKLRKLPDISLCPACLQPARPLSIGPDFLASKSATCCLTTRKSICVCSYLACLQPQLFRTVSLCFAKSSLSTRRSCVKSVAALPCITPCLTKGGCGRRLMLKSPPRSIKERSGVLDNALSSFFQTEPRLSMSFCLSSELPGAIAC